MKNCFMCHRPYGGTVFLVISGRMKDDIFMADDENPEFLCEICHDGDNKDTITVGTLKIGVEV